MCFPGKTAWARSCAMILSVDIQRFGVPNVDVQRYYKSPNSVRVELTAQFLL